MQVRIFESSELEGSYVGGLLSLRKARLQAFHGERSGEAVPQAKYTHARLETHPVSEHMKGMAEYQTLSIGQDQLKLKFVRRIHFLELP